MPKYVARVQVQLKASVFDPQGHAVEQALHSLGHHGVGQVRMGKSMEVHLEAADVSTATDLVRQMCETVLCNPVIETFNFTLTTEQDNQPAVLAQPSTTAAGGQDPK
ncbi:phosphoribosylformylglycinamidine synthase subunit PurS [Alicyclobacillaceae bacterium I2511]|nr:phosphoribosylformylglycinamidine synthase subunit PurS [Alicyclobacillaceae bacterium I2511]